MNISADSVKELRERTGAGMMDCKKALSENSGDINKAIESLRKHGLAKAAKKASRSASEGLVCQFVSDKLIVMADVNCETDFVCKTDEFQNFVKNVTAHIAKTNPENMEALLASSMNGKKLSDIQTEMVAKIGENIGVRRFAIKKAGEGKTKTGCYVHAGSKIGVIVIFEDPSGKLSDTAARDVAMHVAAMNPTYVRKSDISKEFIAKEKEVFQAQMAEEKKPPQVMEKIIEGKLNKYLSEICLEDQIFIRDPSGKTTVAQMLKTADASVKIREFVRFQVGEGVEKKKQEA
ncbi:MAG: elongation factor Ts [Deltaproteobacteria bacterium]|nr:elongation factor Ts [Deltaproteobacteria bacterium]MBI2342387.1 elongation factor Ts [Deltaproteobacteria bacterium]